MLLEPNAAAFCAQLECVSRGALKLCLPYNASMEQRWLQEASSGDILQIISDLIKSDSEDEPISPSRGLRTGKAPNFDRGREEGHARLVADFFSSNPVYNDELFPTRFRMPRDLFLRIVNSIQAEDQFFVQRRD